MMSTVIFLCGAACAASDPASPAWWSVLPFVVLLLAIAAMPLLAAHWWHRWYPAVAVGLGALTASYYLFGMQQGGPLLHAGFEYVSFISLIACLYLCTSGIVIGVGWRGGLMGNLGVLLGGAVLSNLVGTTGAALVLIRPFLRMNRGRLKAYHLAFFIFFVANIGGSLTPIGDPPLLLGYLKGIPFWHFLELNWAPWLLGLGLLTAIFAVLDARNRQSAIADASVPFGWSFQGFRSLGLLALGLGAIFLDPSRVPQVPALHLHGHAHSVLREALLIGIGIAAWKIAPQARLTANGFSFAPLREVAWLFIGIFLTMVPALALIREAAATGSLFGVPLTPLVYYVGAGVCSAALDNAPTFIAFLSGIEGQHQLSVPEIGVSTVPVVVDSLAACAVASVFWGAATYIGNGPNFMVKAVAEASVDADGKPLIDVPSFGGYLVRFALPYLLPVLIVVGAVFFWR